MVDRGLVFLKCNQNQSQEYKIVDFSVEREYGRRDINQGFVAKAVSGTGAVMAEVPTQAES